MADTQNDTSPGPHKARSTGIASSILIDMADTTWRMFVPTIGLLLVGRSVDTHFGTKPWFMLVGTALGAAIAALLIKRQLVTKEDK